ncbi:MAG: hypothetical protein HWE30_03580 [Methylocystaceae bacterium]|nr:hypothetical protein [Methylocystaceae bacterium]
MTYDQNQTTPQPQQAAEPKNGPVDTVRDKNLKASIWRNQGERSDFFTVKFAKTYRDRDGTLRDTNNFTDTEVLRLSELARRTYSRVSELEREAFREKRQAAPQNQRNRSRNR